MAERKRWLAGKAYEDNFPALLRGFFFVVLTDFCKSIRNDQHQKQETFD